MISYNDYVACGGEQRAKLEGKLRMEGANYIVQDGKLELLQTHFSVRRCNLLQVQELT